MRPEFFETKMRPRRVRRSPGDRLREAIMQLAGGEGNILTHQEKAWASITFSGTRHEMLLAFDGENAVAAGEAFIAALPDHEFAIPGQLVADANVSEVDHALHPAPRMVVTIAVLMLEEA